MKEKIKDLVSSLIVIFLIVIFGFAPIGQKGAFTVEWGTLGVHLVEAGVVDMSKMESLHMGRGGMSGQEAGMMRSGRGDLEITAENSHMALHMLWALGLANKNPVLEEGPMMDPRYGGPENFASTGGWTLGKGSAMDHYSMHELVRLTDKEQKLVEKVAKNIYRPCCRNSTYFPDCNHGMAMLGLLELMASQGATETEMYQKAQEVNALWFPKVQSSCGA